MLTCYDASFAALMDQCGVETLLIGDSLGMVCQGLDSTLPVSIDEVAYHTSCVARGNKTALIVADMPFGTYPDKETAYVNAVKLIKAGAHMVKLEGGILVADTIRYLVERSIPVCGHVGLTPQSVNRFGGYRIQGKSEDGAAQVMADAKAVEAAGATMVVLEAIPAILGKSVTEALNIPTIGIGAGPDCSGNFNNKFNLAKISRMKLTQLQRRELIHLLCDMFQCILVILASILILLTYSYSP